MTVGNTFHKMMVTITVLVYKQLPVYSALLHTCDWHAYCKQQPVVQKQTARALIRRIKIH